MAHGLGHSISLESAQAESPGTTIMPSGFAGRPLLPSLLDRLERAASPVVDRAVDVNDLRAWVLRDLVSLLNSRRTANNLPSPLDDSLLAYGLPDLTNARLNEASARERLRDAIADAIDRFEPRLFDVRITVDALYPQDLRLRFRIEAMLRAEPEPQPFTAEPLLDLPTRAFAMPADEPPPS